MVGNHDQDPKGRCLSCARRVVKIAEDRRWAALHRERADWNEGRGNEATAKSLRTRAATRVERADAADGRVAACPHDPANIARRALAERAGPEVSPETLQGMLATCGEVLDRMAVAAGQDVMTVHDVIAPWRLVFVRGLAPCIVIADALDELGPS